VLGQARAEPADLAAMVDLVFGDVERARAPETPFIWTNRLDSNQHPGRDGVGGVIHGATVVRTKCPRVAIGDELATLLGRYLRRKQKGEVRVPCHRPVRSNGSCV
jgi:hypothetical protein